MGDHVRIPAVVCFALLPPLRRPCLLERRPAAPGGTRTRPAHMGGRAGGVGRLLTGTAPGGCERRAGAPGHLSNDPASKIEHKLVRFGLQPIAEAARGRALFMLWPGLSRPRRPGQTSAVGVGGAPPPSRPPPPALSRPSPGGHAPKVVPDGAPPARRAAPRPARAPGVTRTRASGGAARPSAGTRRNIRRLPLKVAVGTVTLMGRY